MISNDIFLLDPNTTPFTFLMGSGYYEAFTSGEAWDWYSRGCPDEAVYHKGYLERMSPAERAKHESNKHNWLDDE